MKKADGSKDNSTLDLSRCADCTCFNLRKASRAITGFYDEMLKPSGLRATQFTLLVVIHNAGDATINTLAKKLVMDRTTLTRNLKPLEKTGLIETSPGVDRRTRSVALSERGREKLRTSLPLWERAQDRLTGAFGQHRLLTMIADLTETVAAVKPG